MKKWYQSKMVWVNTLTLLVGMVGYVAGHDIIQDNATIVAALIVVQGAVNVMLRFMTGKAIK